VTPSRDGLAIRAREESLILAVRAEVVPRDEPHDAFGGAVVARELGPAASVIEIAREGRVARGETRPHARRERFEENARDTVPEQGVRWFRDIVEEARGDELFVRAELAKDAHGLGRVPIVRAGWAEVSHGLPHTVKHR
jgi:hypothetical protein